MYVAKHPESLHSFTPRYTAVARDSLITPIHGTLHILVGPVTCGCGEISTGGVGNNMERGDGGLLKGIKYSVNAWELLKMLHATLQ